MGHRRWTTYITPPTHQITVQIKRHALSAVRYNNCLDASPFSMFFLTTGYACLAESVFVPRLFSFSFFFFFSYFPPSQISMDEDESTEGMRRKEIKMRSPPAKSKIEYKYRPRMEKKKKRRLA